MKKHFIRNGLPTQEYSLYVTRLLQPGASVLDPFTIDMRRYPHEELESYVERKTVHDKLQGSGVFIGRDGIGKSRLIKHLQAGLSGSYRTLFVNLPVAEMPLRSWGEDWMEGKVSCLTLEVLVPTIFETYWQNFINNLNLRQQYIHQFTNPEWQQRLHWFYTHYRPVNPQVERDPHLTDWLNKPLDRPHLPERLSPEETIHQLITLVTGRRPGGQDLYKPSIPSPYDQIEILIDDIERISELAATRLIREAQRLYDLCLAFKIFLPLAYEDRLDDLECVRQGRITSYHLPPWNREELIELLSRRWAVFSPGEVQGVDWPRGIGHLETTARAYFLKILVSSALRVYDHDQKNEEQDAPIHALKLARAFIYASYECEIKPKSRILLKEEADIITVQDLRQISDIYWQ